MAADTPGGSSNLLPVDQNQQKLNDFFGGDLKGTLLSCSRTNTMQSETRHYTENPSDDLLNRYETFIEGHCAQLHQLQEKFCEHNITDTWDSRDDFLSLDVSPYENVLNPVMWNGHL